jgi:hypothetical protein
MHLFAWQQVQIFSWRSAACSAHIFVLFLVSVCLSVCCRCCRLSVLAARYKRYIVPLLSVHMDFYIRVSPHDRHGGLQHWVIHILVA